MEIDQVLVRLFSDLMQYSRRDGRSGLLPSEAAQLVSVAFNVPAFEVLLAVGRCKKD